MKLKIRITKDVEIDQNKLAIYAMECRGRFALPRNANVNMVDLLNQASIDGDIELPQAWELDDQEWDNDLSPEDIKDLINNR